MKKILLILALTVSLLYVIWWSIPDVLGANNPQINERLNDLNDSRFIFVSDQNIWEQWIYATLLRFAMDLKNLFYIIATVFFLIIALRLILASNTEEELWKFKKGIIWITIGLIVMQIAFVFTTLLFDMSSWARWDISSLWADKAKFFFDNLIWPLITLLQTLASFFFIAIAIYAFYRLVTANGNDEATTSAKKTIGFALIWFLIVSLAKQIVEAFYGTINCWLHNDDENNIIFGQICWNTQDISDGVRIIINIINWFNWFVAIIVVLMILYAWAQILLSAWDEEKLKKSKNSLIFIAVWIFILIANFLILTFFLRPESII